MEQSNTSAIQSRIVQFEQFLASDPENQQLLVTLGDLYHQISDFSKAVDCYQKSLSIKPNPVAQGRLASVLISQHQFDKAEDIFQDLINNAPNDPALLFNLGLSKYFQHDWTSAKENFESAITLGADKVHCLPYLARCHHHLHQFDEAILNTDEWLLLTDSSNAKGYLSLLQMDSGNPAKARELAYEVLSKDPTNSDAALVVGTYEIEEQDVHAAAERFKMVLDKKADNPRVMFALGLTYLHQQKHDKAISLMEKASTQIPTDAGMKVAIAWAKTAKQDLVGAEKAFLEVIKTDRSFADGHGGLAYIYALQGKVELAKEEIKTAQWLDPGSFGAVAAQSVIKGFEEGTDQAVEFLAAALEQPPGPGQKPIISHIETYMKKHGPKKGEQPKDVN